MVLRVSITNWQDRLETGLDSYGWQHGTALQPRRDGKDEQTFVEMRPILLLESRYCISNSTHRNNLTKRARSSHLVLPRDITLVDRGPPIVVTNEVDTKLSSTSSIVIMVDEHITVSIGENSRMARTVNIAVAGEKLCAAAVHHRHAGFVDVGAGYGGGATNHGAVSALDALATAVEGGPEVEVVAVLGDERRLNGTTIVGTGGDGDDTVTVDGLTGGRTQLYKFEAGPERAE